MSLEQRVPLFGGHAREEVLREAEARAVEQTAEGEHDEDGGDEGRGPLRRRGDPAGDAPPGAVRRGVALLGDARPEGAAAEQGQQRRHQREPGDERDEHADPEHGREGSVVAVLGEEQGQHGQRDGETAGRDRLPGLAERRRESDAGAALAAQVLPVPRDEQKAVVGAGAEQQDHHQRRGLSRERETEGLGQEREDAAGHEVAEAHGDERHERQDRRAIDEQEQHEHEDDRSDQQLDVGVEEDLVDIGDETTGAGDPHLHATHRVAEVVADGLDRVAEGGVPGVAVEAGEDEGAPSVGREAHAGAVDGLGAALEPGLALRDRRLVGRRERRAGAVHDDHRGALGVGEVLLLQCVGALALDGVGETLGRVVGGHALELGAHGEETRDHDPDGDDDPRVLAVRGPGDDVPHGSVPLPQRWPASWAGETSYRGRPGRCSPASSPDATPLALPTRPSGSTIATPLRGRGAVLKRLAGVPGRVPR